MPEVFKGLHVVVSPDVPKMQLSEECPVSDEFRTEMNAWMLQFFGVTNHVEDGQVFHMPHINQIIVNPRTYAAFRQLHT